MFINRVNRLKKKITLYNDNDSGNSSQCNDCVDYDLGVYYYLLLTQNSTTRYCQLLLQHHQISNKTITILFYEMLFLLSDIWVMYILQLWEDNFSNDMYSLDKHKKSSCIYHLPMCVFFSFWNFSTYLVNR